MSLHLTKTESTMWQGNGFGTLSAEWCVKGHEHIKVVELGAMWYAIRRDDGTRLARGYTRKDCLEQLERKLNDLRTKAAQVQREIDANTPLSSKRI